MLVSIFTPTHNPGWLGEAFDSIVQQEGPWEWIIHPHPDVIDDVNKAVRSHPWVKIIPQDPEHSGTIGALKRTACSHAEGEFLVELDHDDFLAPDILYDIRRTGDKGGDFIFSDVAVFYERYGRRWPFAYASAHGWENYTYQYNNRNWAVTRAFPVTARSLCEIYYAPDHVRCWRRSTYQEVGGHDPALSTGDDHDLMCRTYLAGATFAHIPRCGYFYRFHPNNSFQLKQEDLAWNIAKNRADYLGKLAMEWCRREGLAVVMADNPVQTASVPDGQAGMVIVKSLLDRQIGPEYLTEFMNDTYESLAPGGWLMIETSAAVHERDSFEKYTKQSRLDEDPKIRCRYQCIAARNMQANSDRIQVIFSALKGQRQPGKIEI